MSPKLHVTGRIGRIDTRNHNGRTYVTLSVGSDDGYKDRESGNWVKRTEWTRIECGGPTAEFLAKYGNKGDGIYAVCTKRTRKYQKDGRDVYVDQYWIEHRELFRKGDGQSNASNQGNDDGLPPPGDYGFGDDSSFHEDDIPFGQGG